ncbi:DNA replication ATP-dependent helicase Dna2 [Dysgonomonas sp. PH5-45]|uniref:AAA domain-containing protein n=1 Tax=unclassified Dysgonomonas TaxID=2630389 RepID=UPI0024748D34|nr:MULTISPECIES: AAA domain-containing protein [unclassified Dysgonomonas]MDH6353952.1 DNA replication ATP-dependent helicase Dna2 [Dysgonomonas sp. PH5-45]MDH6386854.1 DNA replication ATP-dependent helicase Dna2 [Dysgonomonas sp. PH5-37]
MSERINKYNKLISEIEAINISALPFREKYIQLKYILERVSKESTESESLQFSSLFSRLVFISQKYKLNAVLSRGLQTIRVKATLLQKDESNLVSSAQYNKAYIHLKALISKVYNVAIYLQTNVNDGKAFVHQQLSKADFVDYKRIQITYVDYKNELIEGVANTAEAEVIKFRYNIKDVNDAFRETVARLWLDAQVNLLDSKIDKDGCYIPSFIVLEPDYLVDASAMAECFQNYGSSHLHYFRRKFEQTTNSQHILLGNLANFFLDELIYADSPEDLEFDTVFLEAFKQKPFEFTSCNEIKQVPDFKLFMAKAKGQFENIKRVVTEDFKANKINRDRCTLEPSFYSEKYGFQGRLDLLQLSEDENSQNSIIELKSGGLPYPKDNKGKVAINHEVQTAIYRLIIRSVFGYDEQSIMSAILYSAADNKGENLRFSAPYRQLEKEIINTRNLIVAIEHDLYTGVKDAASGLFSDILNLDNYGKVPDFFVNKIQDFGKTIDNLTTVERSYLFRYITFISRELYIQKVGGDTYGSNSSTACLWNTEFDERLEAFDLISDLKIEQIDDSGRDMKILFSRHDSSEFNNFREGEICIVYPHEKDDDSALSNQVLKGTVAEITPYHILLRFRYKQRNKDFLQKYTTWVLEHDRLDQSYNSMYRSLFSFLQSPPEKRELLLGLCEPSVYDATTENITANTAQEKQDNIINKAINSKDYFLIVGPPGTGKTSIFARRLIEHYYNNTQDDILVVAYTNKAVDELCEAINQAFGCADSECTDYIRIGTELSCGENYRHRLLQNISNGAKRRDELRTIIHSCRIFVGTLAAIVGKPELFDIKRFNLAIVDEASQILEPQIVGLLTNVNKFILIGDHKQLSTITLQNQAKSEVKDPLLNNIGLYNCSESFFERLYRLCKLNNWQQAYDTLVYQGRMHEVIAEFPNKYFYNSKLSIANKWQKNLLQYNISNKNCNFEHLVRNNRLAFVDTGFSNDQILNDKTNSKEAYYVVELSKAIISLYNENNLVFDTEKTLGIITPYRNQIALIKHKLAETGINELKNVMVDTVERYQGSQKDIIILSFCINKPYQLDFFCNMNSDQTVDRKLNVALTRARQQFFLIGNQYILSQNKLYRELLQHING